MTYNKPRLQETLFANEPSYITSAPAHPHYPGEEATLLVPRHSDQGQGAKLGAVGFRGQCIDSMHGVYGFVR